MTSAPSSVITMATMPATDPLAEPLRTAAADMDAADSFDDLFRSRLSKSLAVSMSCLGTVAALVLIYSIIWFEQFGTDQRRTLQNKFVSSSWWCGWTWLAFAQPVDTLRYLFGPLNIHVCRWNYFLKLVVTTQGMIFLDCIMITRYIFIFRLKNPAAFNDEFWGKFINFWVILFSWSAQFIFDVVFGVDSHHIYICNGTLPPSDRERTKLLTNLSFNNILRILTIAIHFLVMIRIQIYKRKGTATTAAATAGTTSKSTWLKDLENQSLADLTANLVTVSCIVLAGLSQLQINFVNISDFNRYPHYLYEYFYRMVRPPLTGLLVVIMYYVRHRLLRKTIFRELKSFVEKFLPKRDEPYSIGI